MTGSTAAMWAFRDTLWIHDFAFRGRIGTGKATSCPGDTTSLNGQYETSARMKELHRAGISKTIMLNSHPLVIVC